MRTKKRYLLVEISGITSAEEFEKAVRSTLNNLEPLISIKANLRIIKDCFSSTPDSILGILSVDNSYKNQVIFLLSLIGKFYKSNLLTLKSSGSLKKIKLEETRYGTNAK